MGEVAEIQGSEVLSTWEFTGQAKWIERVIGPHSTGAQAPGRCGATTTLKDQQEIVSSLPHRYHLSERGKRKACSQKGSML